MRNVIRYIGIFLVIVGIFFVMSNLFSKDADWSSNEKNTSKTKTKSYNATIQLLDKDTEAFLSGANLVLKDASGETVGSWTTEAGVHLIQNLDVGTYVVEEVEAPSGYHLSEEVTFEVKNSDETVTMYNIKMTEEEMKQVEEENRIKNTTGREIGVENTLSLKNIWSIIGGIASIALGIGLIIYHSNLSKNDI